MKTASTTPLNVDGGLLSAETLNSERCCSRKKSDSVISLDSRLRGNDIKWIDIE
jgi:hypothetical protein